MSTKYYQCPYCNDKFKKEDLPHHFELKHMDVLPEGFTPLRMAFHVVNGKDTGYRRPCRICGVGTEWDENKGRYNFLCGKKSCHDAWVVKMKKTMGDKMGSNRPTASVEGLEKMLNSRSISGTYTFQDGNTKSYTGSYEKKALEFFDLVLNCKSEDIQTPGPVLEYVLDGKKHLYIPDIYYIPYNLIIEVKDGGNHPNKNAQMVEVRKKQIAKEKFIIQKTNYNYLRLTDNDFSQLLSAFADLKMHLVDDNKDRVIQVNEDATTIGAMPMAGTADGVVVVNYLQNNVFAKPDVAVADSPKLEKLFIRDKWDNLEEADYHFLENTKYTTYYVTENAENIRLAITKNIGKPITENFLYETIFGHKKYSEDQIQFESAASPIDDIYTTLERDQQNVIKYIKGE